MEEKKISMESYIPLISVLISFAGVIGSVYYSNQSIKNRDVETVKKEVARDTEISVKLDSIMRATTDTDRKIEKLESKLDVMKQDNVAIRHDFDALEMRVDKLENRLELLHKEHRERAKGGCLTDAELGR